MILLIWKKSNFFLKDAFSLTEPDEWVDEELRGRQEQVDGHQGEDTTDQGRRAKNRPPFSLPCLGEPGF